jgi:very-short-patch-repair endonuclease
MVARRKNSTRTGWDSVVEKLSRKTSGEQKKESRARYPESVAGRKPRRVGRMGSDLELTLHWQLIQEKITGYTMEYRFHPTRKWRFDFCWPQEKIAVEVEGGTWSGGRHTTGSGFRKDCEKYNHAAKMGFYVFRFTGDMVKKGEAIEWIKEMMNGRNKSE